MKKKEFGKFDLFSNEGKTVNNQKFMKAEQARIKAADARKKNRTKRNKEIR